MIGESHVLVFSTLLFRPDWSEQTFLCKTKFLPHLRAGQYLAEEMLNPQFIDALFVEGLLDKERQPAFMHAEQYAAYLAGMPLIAPPIVLFAGEIDLFTIFNEAGNLDFELSDDPGYGINKSKELIPYSTIHDRMSCVVSPFLAAAERLQEMNFSRLMIHCLPPRSTNNKAAARWAGGAPLDAPIRAKLTIVVNRLLAAFCNEKGLGFIDTWQESAANGYLQQQFELDGLHLNRKSIFISLDKIAAHLFDQTTKISNIARYTQALEHAKAYTGDSTFAGKWLTTGLVSGHVSLDFIAKLCSRLSFTIDQGNAHARQDWIGWPRTGRLGVTLAEPDESILAKATSVFQQANIRALLHAGAERELTIINFRPVRIRTFAEILDATHLAPPGVRHAILFLGANDRISFESLDGRAIPCLAQDKGSLIVYDPRRVRCRFSLAQGSLDLLELTLIPKFPGHPFRTVWAGLCEWPADPFQFSVSGMKAFPAFKGNEFSEQCKISNLT
jgi:hypothetical protein